MPGVLPEHIRGDENQALEYTQKRCQKYVSGEAVKKRTEEIKQESKEDAKRLILICMDEAHYNATGYVDSELN